MEGQIEPLITQTLSNIGDFNNLHHLMSYHFHVDAKLHAGMRWRRLREICINVGNYDHPIYFEALDIIIDTALSTTLLN